MQRRIADSVLHHRRVDNSYDSKLVLRDVPGHASSTITKVYQALKANNWIIPSEIPEEKNSEVIREPQCIPNRSNPVVTIKVKPESGSIIVTITVDRR
ncbi:MAG: hypothetical protein ABSF21_00325 [Dehalococcoidia bacterium]